MVTKEKIWKKEEPLYKALIEWGEENELVKEFILKVKKAIEDRIIWTVSCMDDRLSIVNWTIRIAGSWNLLSDAIWEEDLINILKELEVKKITTHNDCWAAWIYANWKNLEEDIDADEITRQLMVKLCNNYTLEHEHISDIDIPHGARSMFVDTTAKFNPSKVSWLPESFVITAKSFPINHIIEQINVAIDIAIWDHWYWKKINKKNPFFIFIIWKIWENEKLETEIEKIQKQRWEIIKIKYI